MATFGIPGSASAADPSVVGAWTGPFDIGLVGIHSVGLPNGKILLFEKPAANGVGSRAAVFDPVTGFVSGPPPSATLQAANVPDPRDLFCATQSLTPDGRVVVVGGHLYNASIDNGNDFTTVFDPATSSWSYGPMLQEPRWYATTTVTGDGRIFVFSGLSTPGVFIEPVDSYDPATGTLTRLPASADLKLPLYPRMFLRTDGTMVKVGPDAPTRIFDPTTATWTSAGTAGVSRSGEMAALLPGLQKILVAGGGSPGLASAQILDLSTQPPTWRSTASMNSARRWGNGVLLADGTMLAVGGGADSSYDGPVFAPEIFDPVTETWTTMAPQTASRMYHSTAILMPDGRVLSAGQTNGTMQRTAEIFSPPYLFRGPRPTITAAPSTVGYGDAFQISTPDAADIRRVALVRPGSVTHSMHFDQRYVDLSFTTQDGVVSATAPPNGNHAPPGWYMLFVLNSAGVPSVASWVQLPAGPGGPPPPPTNAAPSVNAGPDQSVTLPTGAALAGSVSDDGLPNPPGVTTHTWSKVSGPGDVTFGDASALSTSATFSSTGTYVLRLTADDSALTRNDDLTVVVTDQSSPPTTNTAPSVSAGADQSVVFTDAVQLNGSVTDDGLPNPPGVTSITWSKLSGPGTVTWGSRTSAVTTASFSAVGTYVLRLRADDGALIGRDDVTVTVTAGAGGPGTIDLPVAAGSDDAEERTTTGATRLGSSDLQLTTDGSVQQIVGLRFAGASIPKGAVVTTAYIQFEVDEPSTDAASLTIRGQSTDNAPTFKNVTNNISSRPRTTSSVDWVPAPWPTKQLHGVDQRTPDLSSIVQEIVSRPGWTPGNALVFIVTGTGRRTAESRNGTFAPILHLEYHIP